MIIIFKSHTIPAKPH